jgi:hypothetical protein
MANAIINRQNIPGIAAATDSPRNNRAAMLMNMTLSSNEAFN